MSYPIIDIHTHLGDVLYPNGGKIIEQGRLRKKVLFDPVSFYEWRDRRGIRGGRFLEKQVMKAGMARSAIATRANLRDSMDRYGIDYCVTLAVPPAVTFDDLCEAYGRDSAMLPFTGVDYDDIINVQSKLADDVARGARGLKLHPILQRTALNSPETFSAVEAFAPHGLPVLFHAGYSEYYVEPAEQHLAVPANGHIEPALDLIEAFPSVNFIVGHSGLDGVDVVIELLSEFDNVFAEISFQDADNVRNLIGTFGPDRVLYGSDWPWGTQDVSLRIVDQACGNNEVMRKKVLSENAAQLLKLDTLPVAPAVADAHF